MSYDEELRWVKVPTGTHRSRSHETPGYERDLLREEGTNKLRGPTESRPADVDEIVRSRTPDAPARPSAGEEFGRQLGDAIADALHPYIEQLVDLGVDAAARGISNLWAWAKRKTAERRTATSGAAAAEEPAAPAALLVTEEPEDAKEQPIDGAGTGIATPAPSMSGEEFRARLLSALAAEHYAAQQKRLLASVHVQDDALPDELKSAIKKAIEGDASSLDEHDLARVVEFVGDARTPDGEYQLVKVTDSALPPQLALTRDQGEYQF